MSKKKQRRPFWNYRIIYHPPSGIDNPDGYYAIHEVFYSRKGKPRSVTAEPVGVLGKTLAELTDDFILYRDALRHPPLNYDDF